MDLYTVSTDYIDFLRKYQSNVWLNEENFRLRPYVGMVIELCHCIYFAPLSSPKPKHNSMKDRLDFIRLEHRGQLKGVVNLNNMIPVTVDVVKRLEIQDTTIRRKMLWLLGLIPDKKSLLLAQKAMSCRRIDKVMKAFFDI